MSEQDDKTTDTSLENRRCPYFPSLEEIATTRFEFMFPKYDLLVPADQKKFKFPEPYNPQAQGIMPLQDTLEKTPEYKINSDQSIDKTRIALSKNIETIILQNLEPGLYVDRDFGDRGGNN